MIEIKKIMIESYSKEQLIDLASDLDNKNIKLKQERDILLEAINYYAKNEIEPIDYLVARGALQKIKELNNEKKTNTRKST